jgi:hypothetical protein
MTFKAWGKTKNTLALVLRASGLKESKWFEPGSSVVARTKSV